jgi:hypothetical protein
MDKKWYAYEEAPHILPPKGGERNVVDYATDNVLKNKIFCQFIAQSNAQSFA